MLYVSLFFVLVQVACSGKDNAPSQQEKTYPIVKIETRLGVMHFWLFDETPNHKAKFIELANAKHYNQFTFNRVIRNFVIQGGCPDSVQYFKDSPYLLEPEFVDSIKHVYGALGMGRDDNPEKLSNACQFYVVNREMGLPNLDNNYMIFGKIIDGEDVLEKIEIEPTNANDKPKVAIPLDVGIVELSQQQLLDSFKFSIPE
ncbi:MAG: peptidylprolyl isomerase [Bacteroidia bacterium]|nr:peptidylprolyl isomerase [Bacteroidia bacterium]